MSERRKNFTYELGTMGCKANLADSHALETQLRSLGGIPVSSEATPDLFLLNTCTVTDEADKEAARTLRKSTAELTVATGCFAEVDPERLQAEAGKKANLKVVRNSAKQELGSLIEAWLRGEIEGQKEIWGGDRAAWHSNILPNREAAEVKFESAAPRTRVFYKVQDGCNAFCSYCVIPHARGRSRSLPATQVAAEIQALVDSGVKEVVLTAIHAADYESDGLDFTGLVEKVLAETNVTRLRLTSLDPAEIPDRLLELMQKEPRLCPHFHVSVQSANSRVLEGMKRGYGSKELEERLVAIAERLPHAYVGMDLIAGFPGETDEEFEEGFQRLEKLPWTRAHVFPFSPRKSTAAARLVEQGLAVPASKVSARAKRLRDLSDRKLKTALEGRRGSMMEILVEGKEWRHEGRHLSAGHSRSYFKIAIPGKHEANRLRRVRIVGTFGKDCLKGELV
ncbi:MAG TPA: MiaB/RimO family radical SAM methylthiotransferase [Bdellovibrionota bacterium]